jgi:hypothetical protein
MGMPLLHIGRGLPGTGMPWYSLAEIHAGFRVQRPQAVGNCTNACEVVLRRLDLGCQGSICQGRGCQGSVCQGGECGGRVRALWGCKVIGRTRNGLVQRSAWVQSPARCQPVDLLAGFDVDFNAHAGAQAGSRFVQVDGGFVDHVSSEGIGQRGDLDHVPGHILV